MSRASWPIKMRQGIITLGVPARLKIRVALNEAEFIA